MTDSSITKQQKQKAWDDILILVEKLKEEGLEGIYLEDLRRARAGLRARKPAR